MRTYSMGGAPPSFERYDCSNCGQTRIGDPTSEEDPWVIGVFAPWNRKDDCDDEAVAAHSRRNLRAAAGAGVEHFAAFVGDRRVGHIF
jgi:hypothetical protein